VIGGGQNSKGSGFSSSTSALPCHYLSTGALRLFIHLSPTLSNLSNWQRLFFSGETYPLCFQ